MLILLDGDFIFSLSFCTIGDGDKLIVDFSLGEHALLLSSKGDGEKLKIYEKLKKTKLDTSGNYKDIFNICKGRRTGSKMNVWERKWKQIAPSDNCKLMQETA